MEATEPDLPAARKGLDLMARRTGAVFRTLRDLDVPVSGSAWTVRQTGVHLITGTALAADIATGMPSPVPGLDHRTLATENAQRIADIPEADPDRLAGLLEAAVQRLVEVTAGRSGREIVVWHGGRQLALVHLVGISLGELVLHGHDLAMAAGRPWAVDPGLARLVAAAYAAVDEEEFQLETLKGRTSWTWL